MADRPAPNPARRGVTIVELLVVVGIMLLLATITIPALRPMTEGRRVREAARSINVFFTRARNRAKETGRPVGVMFERLQEQPQVSVVLRQVEVPPPYCGDFVGATVQLQDWSPPPPAPFVFVAQVTPSSGLSSGLVRYGDLIQLNYQGPWCTITSGTFLEDPTTGFINFGGVGTLNLTLDRKTGYYSPYPPPPAVSNAVPFQILRQPVPSAAEPLKLSQRALVDLDASGRANFRPFLLVDPSAPSDPVLNPLPLPLPLDAGDPWDVKRARPVTVMFSPSGSVVGVSYYRLYDSSGSISPQYVHAPATEPIHFLVGKWERTPIQPGGPTQAEDGLLNWEDATNLWVTVYPQTGLVSVAEQNADQPVPALNAYKPSSLHAARRFAREGQISKGGR